MRLGGGRERATSWWPIVDQPRASRPYDAFLKYRGNTASKSENAGFSIIAEKYLSYGAFRLYGPADRLAWW